MDIRKSTLATGAKSGCETAAVQFDPLIGVVLVSIPLDSIGFYGYVGRYSPQGTSTLCATWTRPHVPP